MHISRYTPEFINAHFARDPEPPSSFHAKEALCAVLWCDISKSTSS